MLPTMSQALIKTQSIYEQAQYGSTSSCSVRESIGPMWQRVHCGDRDQARLETGEAQHRTQQTEGKNEDLQWSRSLRKNRQAGTKTQSGGESQRTQCLLNVESEFSGAPGNLQLRKLREQTEHGFTFMKPVCHYRQFKSPEHLVPQQENKGFQGTKKICGLDPRSLILTLWNTKILFLFLKVTS